MTPITKYSNPTWLRLRFLLAPEDSSAAADSRLPSWITPWCCFAKGLLWLAVSIMLALMLGQL